jgi:hypothetical protein
MADVGAVAMGPRFLILSEDGSPSVVPTIAALARALCAQLVTGIDRQRLTFEPPVDSHRTAMSGNRWKSREPRDQRIITDLVGLIAGQLASDNGFVIFHFDGDRPYADRAKAENPGTFRNQICKKVLELLRSPPVRATAAAAPNTEQANQLLSKLLVFTPYYCIEAWTYYNTAMLRRLCNPNDQVIIDSWHAGATEELSKPAEHISVGKDHNRSLAEQQFPTKLAIAAKKSFADTFDQLRENSALLAALQPLKFPWLHASDGGDGPP